MIIVGGRKDKLSNELSHEHFDKEDFAVADEDYQKKLQKVAAETIISAIPPGIRRPLQFDDDLSQNGKKPFEADGANAEGAGAVEDDEEKRAKQEKFKQFVEDMKEGKEKFMQKLKDAQAQEDNEQEENDARENENHFSFYAFEGHTGSLRWKHEPGDFVDNFPDASEKIDIFGQPTAHSSTPDSAYKLHLFHNIKHLGEVPFFLPYSLSPSPSPSVTPPFLPLCFPSPLSPVTSF